MNESPLEQLLEQYRSARLAAKHLDQLRKRRQKELLRCHRLEKQLDKEYLDYVRLKKFPIRKLFLQFLGKPDQQLEIEHQEYLHATLQYNECVKSLELLEFEEKILQAKAEQAEALRLKVESLLSQRSNQLSEKYPKLHREIQRIERSKEELVDLKREIHEALIIGAKAQQIVRQMIELIQAEISGDLSWGNFSKVGQLQAEYNSRGRMDRVVDLSFQLKNQLKILQVEIDDIFRMKAITRFHQFSDLNQLNELFYDRLVSDWILSQGLSSTFQTLRHADDSLKRIMATLQNQLGISDQQIKYLDNKIDDLLK